MSLLKSPEFKSLSHKRKIQILNELRQETDPISKKEYEDITLDALKQDNNRKNLYKKLLIGGGLMALAGIGYGGYKLHKEWNNFVRDTARLGNIPII